nr:uncharacterized mitochondrial protein AtMg00810-like [Tanacetum cinerariifolium]
MKKSVILNEDSLVPTRIVEGVSQPVAPTTAEQRLARKNELKAHGTLLMALPDKHQLKFNSHKDAKTLMEAIEKRFDVNLKFLRSLPSEWKTHTLIWRNKTDLEEQNLDDLFNSLKIYETEVKQPFSSGTATQNLAFVSSASTDSTTDSVSDVASISAAYVKLLASPLPNVDSLSRNPSANRPTFMGFDMSKVECYNCHIKGHFARECRSPKDPRRTDTAEPQRRTVPVETSTSNALVSQCDGTRSYDWSYQAEEEPANFALMAFSSNSSSNNELSPLKPEQDLSHTSRPSAPIIKDEVSDSEEESETKALQQFVPSFAQSIEHVKTPRHSVQPIETTFQAANSVPASPKSNSSGKRRNRKACFVCKSVDHLIKYCDYHSKTMVLPTPRNYAYRGHHKQYAPLTHSKPQKHRVPPAALTQSKPVSNTAVIPLNTALPNITVTRPRNAHQVVTKSKSPIRRHITRNPSSRTSNSPPRVNVVHVPVVSVAQGKQGTWGNPQQALKDKGVIDSGCSRHMTGNMSYLSDFEELNRGYVAFGGNPKGGKITGKGKIKTGKLEFDNVYFVKELKFNLFNVSQMCDKNNSVLFTVTKCLVLSSDFKLPDESQVLLRNRVLVTKPHNKTPYELLYGRTPSIGFMRPFGCHVTILNTLDPLGKFQGKVDEGFLVGYYVFSKAFRVFNSRTRIIQETLHVNFLENKPNVAGTGPTWLFDIDSLTRTMNYQPVHAGNRTNSSAGFQDILDAEKAEEEVDQSYMLFPVWSSVGSTNPQNNIKDAAFDGKEHDFDVKKLESKVILSPSSSAQSKEQDDKIMKEAKGKRLEDIIYSDEEDVVGAEADFNNLKSSILEEPKRVHQALKDPSWIEAMQEELFQFKMQKVWILVDLPYGKRVIVARIEAIRLFLAYASFMGFMVYQMDVKSAFLYRTIEEEVYVYQPLGFVDRDHPDKVKQKKDGIFISQDKYVTEILRKFGHTEGKSASTPIDTKKPLLKDPDSKDVDVYTYMSMIGSLMYLTSSRPDIMFTVCACARFQVTPKASHLHAVKRIFRYLKGKPHLGLWYPKDSPFDLVAYSDSDYVGASLDRISTTEGCQLLRCRLIFWQCKKQIVVATPSTKAEYVAAAS